MANNVNIPAQGTGDTTPKVSTDQVSADSSQVQNFQQVSVSGGVLTRNPTIPVSATSLPLPAGAATETSVALSATALGAPTDAAASTTGSVIAQLRRIANFLAGTLTVSGTVTTTPPSNASTNIAQVAGTAAAVNSGVLSAGVQRVTLATDQVQLTNALKVDGSAVTQPVSGTVTTTPPNNASSNVAQINGVTPLMGNGVTGTGSLRVTLASDQTALTNALKVDGSAVTQPVSGTVTTTPPSNASTNLAQVAGATTATGHGTAAGALRVELPTDGTGTVVLAAGAAAVGSVTTELAAGLTTFSNTALSSTKTAVKAGAGKVYGWMVHNPSAATAYIQVWDVVIGSITVGTTAPTWTIPLPAGASANVMSPKGITHANEINVAATTTATGSSAPATALVVSLFYI